MHLPALVAYLAGLREHNDKAWFVMNKPAYDILRAEFVALVAQVISTLAKTDPHVADVDPKKALFRIYRDTRFSNDKTPYKTRFSASIADGPHASKTKHWGPMYYLSIDGDSRLHVGAGVWMPPKEVLASLRRHAVDDYDGLRRLLRGKRVRSVFDGLSQEGRLARLPKGFDATAPEIVRAAPFVRLKSFVLSTDVDLASPEHAARATDDLAGLIADRLAAAAPLNDWLRRAPVAAPVDGRFDRFDSV